MQLKEIHKFLIVIEDVFTTTMFSFHVWATDHDSALQDIESSDRLKIMKCAQVGATDKL